MFDTGMAIHENGKIDKDNTMQFVKGYITFTFYSRIVQLKYSKTRNADYDVQLRIGWSSSFEYLYFVVEMDILFLLFIDDLGEVYAATRFHKEARFLLPMEESADSGKIRLYIWEHCFPVKMCHLLYLFNVIFQSRWNQFQYYSRTLPIRIITIYWSHGNNQSEQHWLRLFRRERYRSIC